MLRTPLDANIRDPCSDASVPLPIHSDNSIRSSSRETNLACACTEMHRLSAFQFSRGACEASRCSSRGTRYIISKRRNNLKEGKGVAEKKTKEERGRVEICWSLSAASDESRVLHVSRLKTTYKFTIYRRQPILSHNDAANELRHQTPIRSLVIARHATRCNKFTKCPEFSIFKQQL